MSAGIRAGSSNDGYIQVSGVDVITALSAGKVGIGTSSPSTELHVDGTITATNFAGNISGTPTFAGDLTLPQWIIHAGDTNTKLGFLSNDVFEIHTAGTERIRVEADGHTQIGGVGLSGGNDHGLTITEPGGTANVLELATSNAIGKINFSRNLSSTLNTTSYIRWGEPGAQGTGDLRFGTSPASNAPVDRLFISSAGKVSVKSAAENTVCISLLDNNSSNEIWRVGQASDGDGYVEVLEDGGTVGCKLDASGNSFTMGNFGIGDASPSQLLTISHAANTTNGILIKNTNNSQASAIAQLELSGGDNSHGRVQFECNGKYSTIRHDGNGHLSLWTNGSNERLRIDDGGSVTIGDAATHSLSAHSEGDDLVIGGAGWRGMTIYGEGGGGVIQFADNGDNRIGQILYDHGGNAMSFRVNGNSTKLSVHNDKVMFTADAKVDSDNSRDLGASGARWKNFYLYNTAYFGPNGSQVKENNVRFQASGAAYIDQATTGQNIIFRTSDSSALDVTAGYISNKGVLSWSGATNSSAIEINAGGGAATLVFDRNGHITSNIRASDGKSNVAGGSGGGSRISLFKNYMHFFTYPYVSGYVTPTYALRFQVDSSGCTNYGSGNGNGAYHFNNQTANTNRHVEHTFGRTGGANRGNTACVYIGENSSAQGEVIVVTSSSNGSLGSGVSIANNSQSWSAYSDTRLKNKISDITNALSGISQIDTWKYSLKSDETNEPKLGVTAQSIQAVYPEVISKRTKITDNDDDTEYLQVAYTELIPVCIAAIKELKSQVETLQSEVAALKSS